MIGIQIENELYDQPEHIATLKRLAREAGLSAPLWTATGWGGAILPPHEVFPLYSGYADGFWAGQGSTWDDSFRDHFRFTHEWDDPGVGGDFREEGIEIVVRAVDPEFPPATCELGGGMATAYHRRPIARGRDIAALANVKIGNGSAWQGFYMYAGGINPADHLQETHATEYPNDLPRFDYDFQAAIGATGRPGPSLGLLRDHNAFLSAFGGRLADMYSSLPDDAPIDIHDLESLRWAVRTDGDSGFLFINTHRTARASRRFSRCAVPDSAGRRATSSYPIGRSTSPAASSPVGRSVSSSPVRESIGRRHPSRVSSTGRSRRSCCARTTGSRRASVSRRGRASWPQARRSSLMSRSILNLGDSLLVDDAAACPRRRRTTGGAPLVPGGGPHRLAGCRLARARWARPPRRAPAHRDPLDG